VKKLRIALALTVALGLFLLYRAGILGVFAEPAKLKQALIDLGPWGQLAFVASYTALQPFGVPGTVFVMAAPLVWPWPVAFALSMIGTMAASVVGFSFARFVGRDWVADKVPARIRAYEAALERRAFVTVALLRFIFWMPQWLHVFLGVSKVPFWTHFWGSVVGYAVPLFLMSYFGEALFAVLRTLSTEAWIAIALGMVFLVAGGWYVARRRGKRAIPPLGPTPAALPEQRS
jgi:uncharacterized membrane protein YdjX (TVP38/TMEM64 family)